MGICGFPAVCVRLCVLACGSRGVCPLSSGAVLLLSGGNGFPGQSEEDADSFNGGSSSG